MTLLSAFKDNQCRSMVHNFTLRTVTFPQSSSFPYFCNINAAVITGHMVNQRQPPFLSLSCSFVQLDVSRSDARTLQVEFFRESCLSPVVPSFPLFGKELWWWVTKFNHVDKACLWGRHSSNGVGSWSLADLMGQRHLAAARISREEDEFLSYLYHRSFGFICYSNGLVFYYIFQLIIMQYKEYIPIVFTKIFMCFYIFIKITMLIKAEQSRLFSCMSKYMQRFNK